MNTEDTLDALLTRATQGAELRAADIRFARLGVQRCPDGPPESYLAAAFLSRAVADGHVCLDLRQIPADAGPVRRWLHQRWHEAPTAFSHPGWIGDGQSLSPIVREGARLYLWRHWQGEQQAAAHIAARLRSLTPPPAHTLRPWLDALFGPADPAKGPDWQRLACALATRAGLFVLTGGPGTGKTTTVVRLLTLLQGLRLAQGAAPMSIGLAAPTGKAAARLEQAITGALDQLPWTQLPLPTAAQAQLRQHLPAHAQTLHRLIGRRGDGSPPRHHADNPLWLDLLLIDEASMIDLELLHETLQALPAHTRLVLIGDRDQLASVEAGAVLAQLCERAGRGHYRPDIAAWLQQACGEHIPAALCDPAGQELDQCVVMLRHSHRFRADSGIGQLAQAVNAGDTHAIQQQLAKPCADLSIVPSSDDAALAAAVLPGWRALIQQAQTPPANTDHATRCAWARELLQRQQQLQVLTPLRAGAEGVQGLNARIAQLLHRAALVPAAATLPGEAWYAGRPVLVLRNQPSLGLMNGDLGLVLPWPTRGHPAEGSTRWRIVFPAPDEPGGVRVVLPGQLAEIETAYAMTVHKAQGSEFDHVVLVLPSADTPLLTRELLYTGITRARQRLTLLASQPSLLLAAATRCTLRDSGLREALQALLPSGPSTAMHERSIVQTAA